MTTELYLEILVLELLLRKCSFKFWIKIIYKNILNVIFDCWSYCPDYSTGAVRAGRPKLVWHWDLRLVTEQNIGRVKPSSWWAGFPETVRPFLDPVSFLTNSPMLWTSRIKCRTLIVLVQATIDFKSCCFNVHVWQFFNFDSETMNESASQFWNLKIGTCSQSKLSTEHHIFSALGCRICTNRSFVRLEVQRSAWD